MYQPVLATIGIVVSPGQEKVLMMHRNKRKEDFAFGKYTYLGGKVESYEDVLTCAKRELYEEAGIHCQKMVFRGTVNWFGFGPQKLNWFAFIFLVKEYCGDIHSGNHEGDLVWVQRKCMKDYPIWEGNILLLPLILDEDARPFHGHMPHDEQGTLLKWSYHRE